jgi:hypothetical protein
VNAKVLNIFANQLLWNFEDSIPMAFVPDGSYGRHVKLDPFPCYPHDVALVERELQHAVESLDVEHAVTVCILPNESISRTNGWCNIGYDYSAPEVNGQKPWSATICLSAKRIPPHPAMTRYLVAHEYGHAVREYVSWKRGDKDCFKLYAEYAELRGMVTANNYGGGTWHARTEELFANDFRILVARREEEFWPHPGFDRPENVLAVVEFWNDVKAGSLGIRK